MKFKKIVSFSILIFVCSIGICGQSTQKEQAKEPPLVPLTEDEKKIDPRNILAKQPDFTATQAYFSAREISGFSAASKVARKGNKYRTDTGFVVLITESKKPTLRLNQDKTYEEELGIPKPFISATIPLNPTDLLEFEDVVFSSLGTIEVDGNRLLKIQAKSKQFHQEVFLYADLSKRNLITIVQILSPQRSSIQRLQEISFEVPRELFDISGYTSLPKYKWSKIENAKIFYDGKLRKDFSVFRYKDYLFVDLQEPHPATGLMLNWHYLVRLKNKTVEVAYRGMLVTKDGELAWQSDATEAFSSGELGEKPDTPTCEGKVCPKVIVELNSVIFPSVYYEDRKSLIKVTW